MISKKFAVLMVLFFSIASSGCERGKWGYGGVTEEPKDIPQYTVDPQVHPKP